MILGFLFFIQTFLKHCKALSTEKYRRYINIYYYYYYCLINSVPSTPIHPPMFFLPRSTPVKHAKTCFIYLLSSGLYGQIMRLLHHSSNLQKYRPLYSSFQILESIYKILHLMFSIVYKGRISDTEGVLRNDHFIIK